MTSAPAPRPDGPEPGQSHVDVPPSQRDGGRRPLDSNASVRPFRPADGDVVNRIAVQAFSEHSAMYSDWAGLAARLACMADNRRDAEILVADVAGTIAGAVIYVAPRRARQPHFDPDWALIRMLVVDPTVRGRGIGKALVAACVAHAIRDDARSIALHTSPMMEAALGIYRQFGFAVLRPAPMNFGAPCSILIKRLAP